MDKLTRFMSNLYESGMAISEVIQHGFVFAFTQENELLDAQKASEDMQTMKYTAIDETTMQLSASEKVLAVAQALGISLKHQVEQAYAKG